MISTSRLLLRRHESVDAGDVLAMMLDPDTQRWNPAPDVVDLDTARSWCADIADWSDGTHASFAAVDLGTGRYAGSMSIHSIDIEQTDAEVGYRVAPWARGRGYAIEGLRAITTWAFENLDVVRLELAHAIANPASCAVAVRSGYLFEGVLRQAYTYGDGLRYDEHLHARLHTDVV